MKHIFLAAITLIVTTMPLKAQSVYYVSPQGEETGDGTIRHPYTRIEEAVKTARNSSDKEITIYLRGGTYYLEEPLTLTPADCKDGRSLRICSYPGEKAVISGGKALDGLQWEPYKRGIMKTRVAMTGSIDLLLVEGEFRPMARYPNYDSTAVRLNGTSAEATSPKRVKKWKHPEGGYLHAMHRSDWGSMHYRITGKDKDGNLALEGGWQNNRKSAPHPQNRMVENVFEELDAPGEWFFDARKQCLYYYPLPGEQVESLHFEVPALKCLVSLQGTQQEPVRNVTFQNLEFTLTSRTFMEPYEPLLRSDWCIYRGGAIFMEGTENCFVRDCDLHHLGGNAVFFSNYNRRSGVCGSLFTQVGASAICVVGSPDAVRSPALGYGNTIPLEETDLTPGPRNDNYPSRLLIADNLIHHIGLFEKQVAGVELSMCSHITVSHNSIYHVPRAGINVSEGTWGGHLIEYNDVFATVMETGDHGAFNSWGRDRFWSSSGKAMNERLTKHPELVWADAGSCTTIANNRFRCDRGWDIDLDDGSSNYHIYNNLCLNGGLKLREGFYRVVENNILVNNTFHPHVWFAKSGDVFARNIVMSPYRPIGVSHWGAEVDYNVFADSTAYRAALRNGTDRHSIVRTIRFKNPSQGDFRVDSLAEITPYCGFRNFEMDNFGVLSPRLKRQAQQPPMPVPAILERADAEVWEWSGLRLKTLNTLGERSATGMDSERGVYIVSMQAMGNPLRDLLRPNDVILKIDGKDIRTLDDWKKAVAETDWSRSHELVIFREQRSMTEEISAGMVKIVHKQD